QPAVVGATQRGGQRRGARSPPEKAPCGVEHPGIDAIPIHVRGTGMGVETPPPSLHVSDVRRGRAPPRAHSPRKTKPPLAPQHSAFYAQPLLSIGIDEELGCAVSVRRIHVLLPEVGRL